MRCLPQKVPHYISTFVGFSESVTNWSASTLEGMSRDDQRVTLLELSAEGSLGAERQLGDVVRGHRF